mmetsp:Transcript_25640/g.51802  ORF Transcript_25640/g.51802 Transcript_25640/m.51802 type:complete len:90 (-) Transcript_25640:563-832(-)
MAPAPPKAAANANAVGDPDLAFPGALPYINRDGKLIPTKDPPYNAKTDVGSFTNKAPNNPTTELARTGSAAPDSSLASRKKMVAMAPRA